MFLCVCGLVVFSSDRTDTHAAAFASQAPSQLPSLTPIPQYRGESALGPGWLYGDVGYLGPPTMHPYRSRRVMKRRDNETDRRRQSTTHLSESCSRQEHIIKSEQRVLSARRIGQSIHPEPTGLRIQSLDLSGNPSRSGEIPPLINEHPLEPSPPNAKVFSPRIRRTRSPALYKYYIYIYIYIFVLFIIYIYTYIHIICIYIYKNIL